MNKNQALELFAYYGWPLLRPFFKLSKRCRRCGISERVSDLMGGVCMSCQSTPTSLAPTESPEASGEIHQRFFERMSTLTGKVHYDALVLLSGGKDSSYILYRLRTEFPKLRLLAVTVHNGFMSDFAIENAKKTALRLQVDWLLCQSEIETFRNILRQAFLQLKGRGTYGVVDFADGSHIFETGKALAHKFQIPNLIGGLSWVQVQRIVGQEDFELRKRPDILEIFPLAVWRTNEQEIRRKVLEWNLMAPGTDSPVVSNSTLITTMAVVDHLNLGYSSFEPEFSQMIREGKSSLQVWRPIFELIEFGTHRGVFDEDVKKTLGQLGLKLSDVVKNNLEEVEL